MCPVLDLDRVCRNTEDFDLNANDAKSNIEPACTGEYDVFDRIEYDYEDNEDIRSMRETPFSTSVAEDMTEDDKKLVFRAKARQSPAPPFQFFLDVELS